MKKTYKISIILLGILVSFAILFVGCENTDNPNPNNNVPELRSITESEALVIENSNNFSFDLFSRINAEHQNENIFISPFSITTALSMTLNGANGETLEAMKNTLGYGSMSNEEINQAYKSLVDFIFSLDKTVELNIANSNWYKDEYHIRPEFESILSDYYDAEIMAADFDDPKLKDEINKWIENATNGKIKNMLDDVPADAVMYLINAIYFKAQWKYKFDKGETENRPFYLEDGSEVQAETMFTEGAKINYSQDNGIRLVDIPYGNGQFYFTILLPEDASQINELAENLTVKQFEDLLSDTISYKTRIYLPKFKLQFKKELLPILDAMGLNDGGSDLSNLFVENLDLFISKVLHQSFLEVNEEGSEAAAATVVQVELTSLPAEPATIHVDRPFLFFIRENHSHTILFSGKLMDPR